MCSCSEGNWLQCEWFESVKVRGTDSRYVASYSKRGGLQGSGGVGDAEGEGVGGPWGQAAAVGTMALHVPAAPIPATSVCVCVCVHHQDAARDQSNCLFIRRHLVFSLDGVPTRKGTTVRASRFFSSGKCHFSEWAEPGPPNLYTRSTPRGFQRRMPPKPSSTTPPGRMKARTIDRHRTLCATFSSVAANTLKASHLDRESRVGRLPEFPGTPKSQSPGHRPTAPLRASLELFPCGELAPLPVNLPS